MKNRLDKYILDKTEELVFITIDESEDLDLMYHLRRVSSYLLSQMS